MKKLTFKKEGVVKVLRVVNLILLSGSLIACLHFYTERVKELDEAQSKIVHYEISLEHQKSTNTSLADDLSVLNKSQMDLKSTNDELLKDNAKLEQDLASERKKLLATEKKLKQSELQAKK